MEFYSELKKDSRDRPMSGTVEKISTRTSLGTKLRDRLKSENSALSYTDLHHHEVVKNVGDIQPETSGKHQKQWREGKAQEYDELVKYMSNLPSYLEKGENLKDNALSFGVLDWGRLEKWQCNHKMIPNKFSRCSPSSSNTSPFFSTDRSSTHSSRGHSCSPARERMHCPTLHSHLKQSHEEGYSQVAECFGGNFRKIQDLKAADSSASKRQQKLLGLDQSFCRSHSEIKFEQWKQKDTDTKAVPEQDSLPNMENFKVNTSRGKMKMQYSKLKERADGLLEPISNVVDKGCPKIRETVVLLLPNDSPRNSHSVLSRNPGSFIIAGQRSTESNRRSYSNSSYAEEVPQTDLNFDIPHSCPLPCEVNGKKHSQSKQHSFTDAIGVKISSDASHPSPHSMEKLINNSCKKTEEWKPTTRFDHLGVSKSSEGSELKADTSLTAKVRNLSPARRFSIGIGRRGRNTSAKEGSSIPQWSSTHTTAKSVSERDVASASIDNSNANSRTRSSPLRRLLDPLMRSRTADCRNGAEPLQKDLTPTKRTSKSSEQRLDSSAGQSAKVKLDLSCKTINVNSSCQTEKHNSSTVQALLQVAIKNGLPLLTLAVDNDSDILAATLRRSGASKKDAHCWIYTFFSIHEIKRRNGSWISQGGKGKHHGYIPNVVAQMKVSDSQFSNMTRKSTTEEFRSREFVLFAVDQRSPDQQPSSIQPNDEIAAIVIKFPKETTGALVKSGQKCFYYDDLSAIVPKEEYPPEMSAMQNGQNNLLVGKVDLSTTVILPSGVHSLPSKGGPSSLIERWKSDGSCDCGGWDLGCKLRVLSNKNELDKKFDLPCPCSPGQFDLFYQEGVLESRPVFSLSPFKDGIYSVEFNSSLSLTLAFSICVAVLDCREFLALPEHNNMNVEKTEQSILVENDGIKAPNLIQGDVPGKYVSYPPLSPVGRV